MTENQTTKKVVDTSPAETTEKRPVVNQPSARKRRSEAKVVRKQFKFGEVQKLKDLSESGARVHLIPTDVPITGFVYTEQLTLGTFSVAEFCVGYLQRYFEDSRIINDCFENAFVGSNRSVPASLKQKGVERISKALQDLEKHLDEIEKSVNSFFKRNGALKKQKSPANYPLEVNHSYLSDKRFNLAILKADELLFNLNHLYRNGGFGMDLLEADDKFKKLRRRILNNLYEVCRVGRSARREIFECKQSAREKAQKRREEAEKKKAELEAKKAKEAKDRVERMEAAKAEESQSQAESVAEATLVETAEQTQEVKAEALQVQKETQAQKEPEAQESEKETPSLAAVPTVSETPTGDAVVVS